MTQGAAEGGAVEAYVALGANVGDRAGAMRRALAALGRTPGVRVVAASPVYETAAHVLPGAPEAPDFLNAVARLRVTLEPDALLRALLEAEAAEGRVRTARWAPRPLDLDLLVYGDVVLATSALTLPHPRLAGRRFVLAPLSDLAPNLRVPAPFSASVSELLARCPDASRLIRTDLALL